MRWSTLLALLGVAVSLSAGCSTTPSSTGDGGPTDAGPTCDDAKCKPGNKCISDGMSLTCRIPCKSNDPTSPDACPAGFHCVSAPTADDGTPKPNTNTAGESLSYCLKDNSGIVPKDKGQFGYPCDPSKGFDTNADCDTSDSSHPFLCYGLSPTDGDAFCTLYDCATDDNCKAGWWCATINTTPNVTSTARSFGDSQVRSACLPRAWNLHPGTYPAPCKADLDCPLDEGTKQHCVDPGDGKHLVCAKVCKTASNCNFEANCIDVGIQDSGGNAELVCVPRAGTLGPLGAMESGSGGFCSPCHSDVDCGGEGVCAHTRDATERFCTKKSGKACSVVNNMLVSDCPTAPMGSNAMVSCTTSAASADLAPRDQCFGVVKFTNSNVPGCWR